MTDHAAWDRSIWSSELIITEPASIPRAKHDYLSRSREDLLRQHFASGKSRPLRQRNSSSYSRTGQSIDKHHDHRVDRVVDKSMAGQGLLQSQFKSTGPIVNGEGARKEPSPTRQGFSSTPVENSGEKTSIHNSETNGTHESNKTWKGDFDLSGRSLDHPNATMEPLAIVGMAFQFPSGAVTEELFWDAIMNQRCASKNFPKDRMNIDAFYNVDKEKPNSIHTRKGHFLDHDIRRFEAKHFKITPQEAGAMDPNQRGIIETTYHALENAGIASSSISGSNTSVYVGFFSSDHATFNLRDPLRIPKYYATGSSASILSNRISWLFNLRGPSMTIDTACSSSLVAMDLACQGLWAGQTEMAIVAATNLILSPELNIALSNMNFLSPGGKCFSFDHRASRYARGEGFSAVVIKPLSKALGAGDNIRALIRSISSNQDGHNAGGITQPSRDMQAKLIRETYAKAGLDMRETRLFEAHSTGTLVGDPTEARAIGESFREHRSDDAPLYVGAVKSNLGHLEGASGLAGIVKVVMALEKGVIPPNTNFESLHPAIDDEFLRLHFPLQPTPWPAGDVRRASMNAFGFGCSNAHLVLDDAASYLRSRNLRGNSANQSNGVHFARTDFDGHSQKVNGCGIDSPDNMEASEPDLNSARQEIDAEARHQIDTDSPWTPKLIVLSSTSQAGLQSQIGASEKFLRTTE